MDTSKKLTQGIGEIRSTADLTSLKEAWKGLCEDRVFLLSEIERLRAAQSSQFEALSQQVLNAQAFQMDVAQIIVGFKAAGILYDPDELWPKADSRTSIIEILKMVAKVEQKLRSYYDTNDGMSPPTCGELANALRSLYDNRNET